MTTTQSNGSTPKALEHLRVIELGDMPAAYATNWLGGLGADVIKLESLAGDLNRLVGAERNGQTVYFHNGGTIAIC